MELRTEFRQVQVNGRFIFARSRERDPGVYRRVSGLDPVLTDQAHTGWAVSEDHGTITEVRLNEPVLLYAGGSTANSAFGEWDVVHVQPGDKIIFDGEDEMEIVCNGVGIEDFLPPGAILAVGPCQDHLTVHVLALGDYEMWRAIEDGRVEFMEDEDEEEGDL